MGVSTNKLGEILALQQLIKFPTGNSVARLTSWVFNATVIFLDKFYSIRVSIETTLTLTITQVVFN